MRVPFKYQIIKLPYVVEYKITGMKLTAEKMHYETTRTKIYRTKMKLSSTKEAIDA